MFTSVEHSIEVWEIVNSSVANLGWGEIDPFPSVSHISAAVDMSWFLYYGFLLSLLESLEGAISKG